MSEDSYGYNPLIDYIDKHNNLDEIKSSIERAGISDYYRLFSNIHLQGKKITANFNYQQEDSNELNEDLIEDENNNNSNVILLKERPNIILARIDEREKTVNSVHLNPQFIDTKSNAKITKIKDNDYIIEYNFFIKKPQEENNINYQDNQKQYNKKPYKITIKLSAKNIINSRFDYITKHIISMINDISKKQKMTEQEILDNLNKQINATNIECKNENIQISEYKCEFLDIYNERDNHQQQNDDLRLNNTSSHTHQTNSSGFSFIEKFKNRLNNFWTQTKNFFSENFSCCRNCCNNEQEIEFNLEQLQRQAKKYIQLGD